MHRINVLSGTLVLLALTSAGFALDENDPCTNPDGDLGLCIYFRECDSLAKIIEKRIFTPQEKNFIAGSRCGKTSDGKNLVCCKDAVVQEELPEPPNCGRDISNRIVGGIETDIDEFPWTALLQYRKPGDRTGFHCGASLINSRYVVTAGHCIQAVPRGWTVIGVRLGEWDLNKQLDCDKENDTCADPPVDLDVEQIIVHEDYNPKSKAQHNDIALIRFTRSVHTSPYIFPICLPLKQVQRSRDHVGFRGTAAGWGRTENNTASNVKLKVELQVKDAESCSSTYKRAGVDLRDTQLCAGGVMGKDTCTGDSGGPFTRLVGSNHFLVGIVSFGPVRCGTADVPGVYTNVAKYVDWIKRNVRP